MSCLLCLKLSRLDSSIPWGFRLEGGLDVGSALMIQKVTLGGVAEACGAKPRDVIVRINSSDTQFMTHEDAKMEIIRSNNTFEMIVERKSYAKSVISNDGQQVKQSLNSSAVSTQPTNTNETPMILNVPKAGEAIIRHGSDGRVQRLTHSTYNSPMGLYSRNNINTSLKGTVVSLGGETSDVRPTPQVFGGSMRCGACQNLITGGQFVRVQGRIPMHPSCLKCCKCGIGLRNVGYFYINDMLYCETHAKQVARPPNAGLKPLVVYK